MTDQDFFVLGPTLSPALPYCRHTLSLSLSVLPLRESSLSLVSVSSNGHFDCSVYSTAHSRAQGPDTLPAGASPLVSGLLRPGSCIITVALRKERSGSRLEKPGSIQRQWLKAFEIFKNFSVNSVTDHQKSSNVFKAENNCTIINVTLTKVYMSNAYWHQSKVNCCQVALLGFQMIFYSCIGTFFKLFRFLCIWDGFLLKPTDS